MENLYGKKHILSSVYFVYRTIPNSSIEKFANLPAFNLSGIEDRYTINIRSFALLDGISYHLVSNTLYMILVLWKVNLRFVYVI